MSEFNLKAYDLNVARVYRNPPPALLYDHAIRHDHREMIAASGALVAYSGPKTGRSPRDKHIVRHADSARDIWWGSVNVPLERQSFLINRERAKDWLNTRS